MSQQFQYVRVGKLHKIFFHHRSFGFFPNTTIAKGDVLVLRPRRGVLTSRPEFVFTVESMEVDHVQRSTVQAGERCSVQITPFPVGDIHEKMVIFRRQAIPRAEQPETTEQPHVIKLWGVPIVPDEKTIRLPRGLFC